MIINVKENMYNQGIDEDNVKSSVCIYNTEQIQTNEEIYKTDQILDIVKSAFRKTNNPTQTCSKEESKFHIDLCNFISNIPTSHHDQLLRIINKASITTFQDTRIPSNIQEVNDFYLKNKFSITKNMPIPDIFEYDNHACVSIKSIVSHVLSLNINTTLLKASEYKELKLDYSTILNCEKVKELLEDTHSLSNQNRECYVMFIIIWSDDFQANYSRVRKSSTWLKTMTIVHPPESSTSNLYTHAISLGFKDQNHDKVNSLFNNELTQLRNPVKKYIPQLKNYVDFAVRVLTMSADRPERNALNELLSHNGNSSRRWMYSSLVDPYSLASCKLCFQKRIDYIFGDNICTEMMTNECRHCHDFNYESNHTKKPHIFEYPEIHPLKCTQNYSEYQNTIKFPLLEQTKGLRMGQSRSIKLNYNLLKDATKFGLYNYMIKKWSKKECISFLKLLCIKESRISYLIQGLPTSNMSNAETAHEISKVKFPAMWDSILTLDQFIETPMHHLFEGIVKSCIEVLIQFLKYHKKWSKFSEIANLLLENIFLLRLDFCKCETLSSETSGWLAENYLGFSRIAVVIIIYLDDVIECNTVGLKELKMIFQSMYSMISRLMAKDVVDIDELENHIKIFLSTCHFYEGEIGYPLNQKGHRANPFWYNRSNFVSLLNLPEQIKKYGPLRYHWEGSRERFIQTIKPNLTKRRNTASYLTKKMEKIFLNSTFSITSRFLFEGNENAGIIDQRISDLKIYRSIDKISQKLLNFEPLGAVTTQNNPNKVHVIIKKDNKFFLHDLMVSYSNMFWKGNICFGEITLGDAEQDSKEMDFDSLRNKILDCVMIVPLYPNRIEGTNGYTVISKEWKILRENGEFDFFDTQINILKSI